MTATLPRLHTVAPVEPAPPLRAVIYTRVSSDPKDRRRSVAEQEAECRADCTRNGWDVVQVFSDNDRSASRYATKDRPGHRRLVKFLEAGAADVLVTWESSRAQRDLGAYVHLRQLCEQYGILWSYEGRVYDMTDSRDRTTTAYDAIKDERASDETRERVLRAVRNNASKGRPHGKLLYGYRRIYDERTGELVEQVPDPVTSEVVKEAARRVLAGETPYAVAQDYNRRGILPPRGAPRGWDLTQIKRLCVNPGYAGKRVHQGKVIGDATWDPLISQADHLKLVAKLGDPRRRTQRDSAIKHLLSGIAVCGVCGGRMRVQNNRGRLSYMCVADFHVARGETDTDEYITEVVLQRLERPDLADLMAADEPDAETEAAMAEAWRLRGKLDEWYVAAAKPDGPSPQAVARVEAELLPQIEAVEQRALPRFTSPLVAEVAGSDARERWAKLPITAKREIISTLMHIRVMKSSPGRRTFDPASVQIDWK